MFSDKLVERIIIFFRGNIFDVSEAKGWLVIRNCEKKQKKEKG